MNFKGKLNKTGTIIIVVIVFLVIIFNSIDFFMINLPKGELIKTEESGNKEYKLNAYLVPYKDKTGIRVEVVNNKTGKSKNIYWQYPESEVNIIFVEGVYVDINDTLLNVQKDTYKSYNK